MTVVCTKPPHSICAGLHNKRWGSKHPKGQTSLPRTVKVKIPNYIGAQLTGPRQTAAYKPNRSKHQPNSQTERGKANTSVPSICSVYGGRKGGQAPTVEPPGRGYPQQGPFLARENDSMIMTVHDRWNGNSRKSNRIIKHDPIYI